MKFGKYLSIIITACIAFVSGVCKGQAVASMQDYEFLMGKTAALEVRIPVQTDTTSVEFPLLSQSIAQKKNFIPLLNDTVELSTKYKRALETASDGELFMRYDLTIQAFDSGRYELPGFEFRVAGEKVTSNPLIIAVLPVKVTVDDKIDDFSGPAQPFELYPHPEELNQTDNQNWIWWVIGGGLLLILLILGWTMFSKTGSLFPGTKPRPPYQIAIEKLTRLKGQNLPDKGKTKEYYTRMSDILRAYLKKQFGIKTMEKTTAEIMLQVEQNGEVEAYADILKTIFETSDFVKFAKVNPSHAENDKCMADSIRFVEISHPEEKAENMKGKES